MQVKVAFSAYSERKNNTHISRRKQKNEIRQRECYERKAATILQRKYYAYRNFHR